MTMRRVVHSTGLVLATGLQHRLVSFYVRADGSLEVLGGWGFSGPAPELPWPNEPSDPEALHTVLLEDDGDAALATTRRLIDEHLGRYGECQVWLSASVVSRRLQDWVAAGCPEVAVESAAGTAAEDEVAEAEAAPDPREALRTKLDELGVPYDGRWGVAKLAEALRTARAELGEPAGDVDES